MWRRTFIRLTLVVMVVIAGLLVFAASHAPSLSNPKNCSAIHENCGNSDKTQGDFNILESLSQSLMSNVQY